jgi:hypothetical protein
MSTPLIERTSSEIAPEIAVLAQSISDLIGDAAESDQVALDNHRGALVIFAPVLFPGGIGQGQLCAEAFCYRGRVRLDVRLAHNRVFARPDGTPSDRRLYLNDFVASTTLDTGQEGIPDAFAQHVIDGVARARAAVRRHNADPGAYWQEILVAQAS